MHDRIGPHSRTALHYAILDKNTPAVRLLLQAGADPYDVRDLVIMALISGRPEDTSLAAEFLVSEFLEDEEFTLLHKVVMGVAHIPLTEVLLSSRRYMQVSSRSTPTLLSPLHIAAIRDDPDACRLLVQAGASVDSCNPQAGIATPLQDPCHHENYRAANALVSLGASITLKSTRDPAP